MMPDTSLQVAIINAIGRIEIERNLDLSMFRKLSILHRIEKRIEDGEAHDLVFAEETKSLHA